MAGKKIDGQIYSIERELDALIDGLMDGLIQGLWMDK